VATIKDVAKHAGVSASTVSYVLSGKRPISRAVKKRVEKAVVKLGYVRNLQAHNLRKGISHTIGMVHPLNYILSDGMGVDFIGSAAEVLESHALENRYTLSLFTQPQEPEHLLAAFRQRRIDGLILMHITRHDSRVEALRKTTFPFALIGRPENTDGLSLVDFDAEQAAYLGIKHLAELGHRTIAYLDLPVHEHDQDLSYAHYLQRGLELAEQTFGVKLLRQESGRRNHNAYEATRALLAHTEDLSAIVVLAGTTQLGVLRALQDAGKRVPEDCSVLCIGSVGVANWTTPRLTSLDMQLADMGRIAAELVLERISGLVETKQIILPANLVQRESTAPPKKKGY
jgi:DNA-binding LacI/PurR family transcriptional regulator